jgi:hypothetical protein
MSSFIQSDNDQIYKPSFEEIGKSRQFYQWSLECHDDLLIWWHSTPWFEKHQIAIPDLIGHLSWDSSNRRSIFWANFHQVAHRVTGEPQVVCKDCLTPLAHPNVKGGGTNTMRRHPQSKVCSQQSYIHSNSGLRQSRLLEQRKQQTVSDYYENYYIY